MRTERINRRPSNYPSNSVFHVCHGSGYFATVDHIKRAGLAIGWAWHFQILPKIEDVDFLFDGAEKGMLMHPIDRCVSHYGCLDAREKEYTLKYMERFNLYCTCQACLRRHGLLTV